MKDREALAAALDVWDGTPCIWDTGLDGLPLNRYVDATETIATAARKRLAQLGGDVLVLERVDGIWPDWAAALIEQARERPLPSPTEVLDAILDEGLRRNRMGIE